MPVAKRPSGSVFKPFVYAAALNTGLQDKPDPLTASTVVKDEARTFYYGGKSYEPVDYHKSAWLGDVTLRTALAKSLNVPAVEVAEATGYGVVADLAHKAGLEDIKATPAMALRRLRCDTSRNHRCLYDVCERRGNGHARA